MAMANSWALQEDPSFIHMKTSAGVVDEVDDDQLLRAWMMVQDEPTEDEYLSSLFKEPHPLVHKGDIISPPIASTPALPPFPSSPSPSPPNSVKFSRLDGVGIGILGGAKSLLQVSGIGPLPKVNDLHENPSGVVSDVTMGALSSTGSNAGLAQLHQHHHPLILLPNGKELPSSANSSDCSMKTQNKSMADQLTAELEPKVDGKKCSLRYNIGSTKRNRVPEDHNKYEKRRRDKINEKMRTLQRLIPNSNKNDKSSILDEAIEYMKYLQFQIQYMSMQSGMGIMPVMLFTGMQAPKTYHELQYLKHMGIGIGPEGMDMATGFGTGIGHPLSHTETMQTIHGQRIASLPQLYANSSFANSTNFNHSLQSPTTFNTSYGI